MPFQPDVERMKMNQSHQGGYVMLTPPKCNYVIKWSVEVASTGSLLL